MLGNAPFLLPMRDIGADLWKGASSLEELPTVLRVTDPDVPKVLVFHDIAALWGQGGGTWEQKATEATSAAGAETMQGYSTLLTSPPSTSPRQEEEEGSQGWQLCPTHRPRAPRGLTRDGLQHALHRWGRALPSPPSRGRLRGILCQASEQPPCLTRRRFDHRVTMPR